MGGLGLKWVGQVVSLGHVNQRTATAGTPRVPSHPVAKVLQGGVPRYFPYGYTLIVY